MIDDILPVDDISKWEVTGLISTTDLNKKYNVSKLLNNAASLLKALVTYKYGHPSSIFIQNVLQITAGCSDVLGDERISVLPFTPPEGGYQLFDNPDIIIKPKQIILMDFDDIQEMLGAYEYDEEYELDITNMIRESVYSYYEHLLDTRVEEVYIRTMVGANPLSKTIYTEIATY